MSENYVLIADSPDLQSKFAHTTQKKQADHRKGENNLDRFNIRTASGSVSLCKIVSVPSAGYGKGTAKVITGYNADGTPVLAEEETPVFIPRI